MNGNVRFGRFRFDLGQRELSCDGVPVRLGGRALDILSVLASAGGDVVTKDELLARVWPGVVVEENNLQVQISALRKVLDQGHERAKAIWLPCRAAAIALIGLIDPPQQGPRCRTSLRSPSCRSRT